MASSTTAMSSPSVQSRYTRDSSASLTSLAAPFTHRPSVPRSLLANSLLGHRTWTATAETQSSSTKLIPREGVRETYLSPSNPFAHAACAYSPPTRSAWDVMFSSAPDETYPNSHGRSLFPSIPWRGLARPSERHAQRVWNIGVRIVFWAAVVVLFSALLGIGDTSHEGLSMREETVVWSEGGLLMTTWGKSTDGHWIQRGGSQPPELKRAELHEDLGGYWAPIASGGAAGRVLRSPVTIDEEFDRWDGRRQQPPRWVELHNRLEGIWEAEKSTTSW